MKFKLSRFSALFVLVFAFLSGCKTLDEGSDQAVAIRTFPPGATVVLNGEEVGTTPMTLDLGRKITHRVILSKDGYQSYDATIAPTNNAAGEHFVKFGLLDETGYYNDLEPNPVTIQLRPDILPDTRGPDAYTEMSAAIAKVDEKRALGELDPVEHKYMVDQVIQFYTQ